MQGQVQQAGLEAAAQVRGKEVPQDSPAVDKVGRHTCSCMAQWSGWPLTLPLPQAPREPAESASIADRRQGLQPSPWSAVFQELCIVFWGRVTGSCLCKELLQVHGTVICSLPASLALPTQSACHLCLLVRAASGS